MGSAQDRLMSAVRVSQAVQISAILPWCSRQRVIPVSRSD
jgi:hypothetical protein